MDFSSFYLNDEKMDVAKNQIGCGHRYWKPKLNEMPSVYICLQFIFEKIHLRCIKSKRFMLKNLFLSILHV